MTVDTTVESGLEVPDKLTAGRCQLSSRVYERMHMHALGAIESRRRPPAAGRRAPPTNCYARAEFFFPIGRRPLVEFSSQLAGLLEGAKVHDASCMNESVRVQLRAVSRCRSETPSVYLVNLRCKSPHLISATLSLRVRRRIRSEFRSSPPRFGCSADVSPFFDSSDSAPRPAGFLDSSWPRLLYLS